MDYLTQFIIPFSGLGDGVHKYEFVINKEFFDFFEYSEVKKGNIQVVVNLDKQERMMVIDFKFDGYVDILCDRCSGNFNQPVSGTQKLIVKVGNVREEESDEIITIPETDHEIDLSSFIYEYVILLLPVKRIHTDDTFGKSTCDPEVLRILEDHSRKKSHDSRWDSLKNLKSDNN